VFSQRTHQRPTMKVFPVTTAAHDTMCRHTITKVRIAVPLFTSIPTAHGNASLCCLPSAIQTYILTLFRTRKCRSWGKATWARDPIALMMRCLGPSPTHGLAGKRAKGKAIKWSWRYAGALSQQGVQKSWFIKVGGVQFCHSTRAELMYRSRS
jgi:hypothetical protein